MNGPVRRIKGIPLDNREVSTVLAALRLYQLTTSLPVEIANIATDGDVYIALDDIEIDYLCQRINFGS